MSNLNTLQIIIIITLGVAITWSARPASARCLPPHITEAVPEFASRSVSGTRQREEVSTAGHSFIGTAGLAIAARHDLPEGAFWAVPAGQLTGPVWAEAWVQVRVWFGAMP